MAISMAMQGWGPRRRSCSLCGRSEATSWPIYLVGIMIDGVPRRACDRCRTHATFFCQNPGCLQEQGGQRYKRGGLTVCVTCAARIDARLDDQS